MNYHFPTVTHIPTSYDYILFMSSYFLPSSTLFLSLSLSAVTRTVVYSNKENKESGLNIGRGHPAGYLALQGQWWEWLARCQKTVTGFCICCHIEVADQTDDLTSHRYQEAWSGWWGQRERERERERERAMLNRKKKKAQNVNNKQKP